MRVTTVYSNPEWVGLWIISWQAGYWRANFEKKKLAIVHFAGMFLSEEKNFTFPQKQRKPQIRSLI